ncbi:ABC transporter substrate-binding protein [Nocardioidaceae bacterium]|nr:ABC transporter substrate-binding protein [Nocardioidaceae bacterium]
MKRTTRPTMVAAGLLAGSLMLSACGAGGREEGGGSGTDSGEAGDTTGVTDSTISIGTHMPLTGVAAPGYSEIPTGSAAYFDFVNENGGVNGRTIEYAVQDDAYNPTNTTNVVREFVQQDQVFGIMGGLGTPTHGAVVDFLNEQEVPDLFVSSGSIAWGDDPQAKPYTFGWQPDYEIEGKIIGQYVAENFPDAQVGLFLQDDDLGADGEIGLRQFIDDQIVSVARYTSGNTDVAPQITQLQSDGADLVIGFNTPSYTALSQLVALQTQFDPQWIYTNVGSDPALVGGLLANFSEGAVDEGASALDGVLTTAYIPGVDTPEDPWVQLWERVWEEHGGEGELTNYRIYGMSQAYAFVQALQAAGEDLTRQGIVSALEEVGGSLEGPQLAPFRYSADSHLGIGGMRMIELEGTESNELTPVLTTDLGEGTPIEADASEQANDAPPENGIPDVQPVG